MCLPVIINCLFNQLEEDMVDKWKPHYLQYKLLKKLIKDLEQQNSSGSIDTANGLLTSNQTV